LGIVMTSLDGSIANVALPSIARDLHASAAASTWVVNGFNVALAALLFTCGSLGELRGPSRVYRVGLVVFIVASFGCALAPSLPSLVLARVVQGLGAAAVIAISPAIIREIYPPALFGRAIGFNAVAVASASAAGPAAGGLILHYLSWPWLFAINLPIGVLAIWLARALPKDARNGGSLDWSSVVTSALGFASTIWALQGFSDRESAWTIASRLVVGIACGVLFVQRQLRLKHPLVALDLFRIPAFSFACATSFVTYVAQGAVLVSLPFLFQTSLGRTPLQTGALLTSWPVGHMVFGPIAGRLSDRIPPGILSTFGLSMLAIGIALFAGLPRAASDLNIVLIGLFCGTGFGFFGPPNVRAMLSSAPRAKAPSAAAMQGVVRTSGQTVGIAAVAIIFGIAGRAASSSAPMREMVVHGVPVTLWFATACAVGAAVTSGARMLRA
jgi:DHA2 family multidrug resistance protein-like MFS transporter